MKLSNNFTLAEFTESQTAINKGIDNTPTHEHINNMVALCTFVLQPARDKIGSIIISSGYRSKGLNTAIGGSSTSQHCNGMAADVKCSNNALLFDMIANFCEFSQLIWEFGDDNQPSWVHVSFEKGNNKKQKLKAYKDSEGKTKYEVI